MKLLFCYHCQDIVRLFPERRSCKCGRSSGQYAEDKSTTIQTSESLSVGIANQDFLHAVEVLMQDRKRFSPLLSFRGWLNPDSETNIVYEETADAEPEGNATLP